MKRLLMTGLPSMTNKPANGADVARKVTRFQRVFAWPTILMATGSIFGLIVVTWLNLNGMLADWLAFILNTYLLISCFTPLHESVHNNIALPGGRLPWLNNLLGFISGGLLFLPFHLFAFIHLSHHRFANSDLDPDYWLHSKSYIGAISKCATAIPHYLLCYQRACASSPEILKRNLTGLAGTATVYLLPVVIALLGYGKPLLLLWVGPAILAVGLLTFLHWTLHRPYTRRGRFRDANVIWAPGFFGKFLNFIYQMQNYHLVHHLFPRIPFYLQIEAFDELEETITLKGGRIVNVNDFL